MLFFGLLFVLPARGQHASSRDCTEPFDDARNVAFDPSVWKTNFCKHSVPFEEIRPGGPPRDGIPPIDKPAHVTPNVADEWLNAEEPVIAVEGPLDGTRLERLSHYDTFWFVWSAFQEEGTLYE